jgi:hypothetical protein
MSNIYCGSKDEIPKGKKRGSMKQCAELGEIRYFGVKKIDQVLLKSMDNLKKKKTPSKTNLATKKAIEESYVIIIGKIQKQKRKITDEQDKKKKLLLTKELEVLEEKKMTIKNKLNLFVKQNSRTISRSKINSKTPSKSKSKTMRKLKSKSKSKTMRKSKSKSKSKSYSKKSSKSKK